MPAAGCDLIDGPRVDIDELDCRALDAIDLDETVLRLRETTPNYCMPWQEVEIPSAPRPSAL